MPLPDVTLPTLHIQCHSTLLRPDRLQLLRAMGEVVRIRLWHKLPLIWLLHVVLVTLLVRKVDGIFLALELDALAVHEVCGGLPAHEGVLPSVSFWQWIPVHQPV